MKFVLLVRDLDPAGAQRQVVTLAHALKARGVETSVIVFYAGGLLEPELHARGVRTVVIGKRGRWDVVRFLVRFARALRRERPTVLCSMLVLENILAALARPLVPGCRIAWGLMASDMDFSRYDWLLRATARVEACLAPLAHVVVTNSHPGRDVAIARGFPADRLVVVPNGFDVERFRPDPEGARRVRAEWGVLEGAPLVGVVARLDPMKDHDAFLRMAARVAATRPDARFAIVGNGPEERRERLRRRAAELGIDDRITLSPARSDVAAVYAALDVLVSSSAYGEGFSNVLGEAMACGTPCVVTDVGDSALAVGDRGVVAAPGDDAALAAGVEATLERLAREPDLGQRLRERVQRELGPDALVDRMLAAVGR